MCAELTTIFNCSVRMIRPLAAIKLLQDNYEPQMMILQRYDVLQDIFSRDECIVEYFEATVRIFFGHSCGTEMWLSYMQLYEAKFMEVCQELYTNKVYEFVDKIIERNEFTKMMQVALSPNQDALIQTHLARNYQNLSVAKLLWQTKQ